MTLLGVQLDSTEVDVVQRTGCTDVITELQSAKEILYVDASCTYSKHVIMILLEKWAYFNFFYLKTGLFLLETTCSDPDWVLEVGVRAICFMVTSPIYPIYIKGLTPKWQIPLCSPRSVQTLTELRSFVLGSWCSWTERTYECDMCPSIVFCLVMRQPATLRPARWRYRTRPRPFGGGDTTEEKRSEGEGASRRPSHRQQSAAAAPRPLCFTFKHNTI